MTSPTPASHDTNMGKRRAITVTVLFASSMYALDWTIAAVTLPDMQGAFSVKQEQIS